MNRRRPKLMRGFLPLSCDGTSPRLALGGELVLQTNEHTNLCLIKQSILLTFAQLELPHVSAVTKAGGSSGESKTEIRDRGRVHQPLRCNSFFPWAEEKENEEREYKRG